jgi:SAM-dependent methyltransferase
VPYPGYPFAQTHPDRLATIATLLGMTPTDVTACRVLELGCGDGGNLVPMAYALPGSRFVGVDLSRVAVERAWAIVDALGLQNVDVRCADFTGSSSLGTFDYVIAHGVYSWIAPAERDALLALCASALAPAGVAYVSYDALPGGHLREITRQILRWHLRSVADPGERIREARALLGALAATAETATGVQRTVAEQAARALEQRDPSLFHDELADRHTAVLFADFAAHARQHGLRYLAEADFFEMTVPSQFAPAIAGLDDPVEREQYLDFFKGRLFRQTLLCHADADHGEPDPLRVQGMLAASPAQPDGDPDAGRVTFRGPKGASLTTDEPTAKAAMLALGEAWPDAVPVTDLGRGEALYELLLQAYAANLVQLHVWTPSLATTPSERPRASALARLQAAEGTRITNLRHATLEVTDDLGRHLIRLLDGTRDRTALLHALDRPADELERSLTGLAAAALLEA